LLLQWRTARIILELNKENSPLSLLFPPLCFHATIKDNYPGPPLYPPVFFFFFPTTTPSRRRPFYETFLDGLFLGSSLRISFLHPPLPIPLFSCFSPFFAFRDFTAPNWAGPHLAPGRNFPHIFFSSAPPLFIFFFTPNYRRVSNNCFVPIIFPCCPHPVLLAPLRPNRRTFS